MVYTTVSSICIAIMVGILAYFIFSFCKKSRAERIKYIKNFKKGKFLLIYFAALPLNYMISRYAGNGIIVSAYTSVSETVQLVVLKFDVSSLLYEQNTVFKIAYLICLTLVILNAMMVLMSLLYRSLWNGAKLFGFNHSSKDKCIVIGNNKNSRAVYKSCNRKKMLVDEMDTATCEKLFGQGIVYKAMSGDKKLKAFLTDYLRRYSKKCKGEKLAIVINCEDEEKNIDISGYLTEYINGCGEDEIRGILDNFDIYAFGDCRYEELYFKYEEKAKGCFHFINQYRQIAIDFIDKYPLTHFMDQRHIDRSTSLIKEGVDLNVVMLGFGKANRQLFVSMVANNQFLTADRDGNIRDKAVRYRLFDTKHTDINKRVNREYFRYGQFLSDIQNGKREASDYLPLIDKPADEECLYLDLDDMEFFDKLKESLNFGEKSVNYIIVSLGGDYLNIDIANKISSVLKEWKIINCRIFVKVRNKRTYEAARNYCDPDYCIPYGEEESVIYDFANITKERFAEMAITRNFVYDIEKDMKCDYVSENERRESKLKWYVKRNSIERESNIYAVLSLRSKLNMIGLDYCDENDCKDMRKIDYEEYMSIYAKDDVPQIIKDENGEAKRIEYPLEFKPSLRKNLATQEHARWNAFMIMKGFVPAKIDDIMNEVNVDGKFTNGKNYAIRHHGNLTTFEGLKTFRQAIAKRDGKSEKNYDVIKYDYQLMDGAWWLLNNSGYKIIEKR